MSEEPEVITPRRIRVSISTIPPKVIDLEEDGDGIGAVSVWKAFRPLLWLWLGLAACSFLAGVLR